MAYTPFTKDDQPTMQAFNEAFEGAVQEALFRGVHLQTGTYTGKGVFGKDKPTTLTFSFTPRIVIVCDVTTNSGNGKSILVLANPSQYYSVGGEDARDNIHITWTDKSVSWWIDNNGVSDIVNVAMQANSSGVTYNYLVFW